MHLADRVGGSRRGHDGADAPPRHAERLGSAADRYGALAHAVQGRDRGVLAFVIDVLVDLVGHCVGVVAPAQCGDALELRPRQHPTGRIVGGAHDDGAGAR